MFSSPRWLLFVQGDSGGWVMFTVLSAPCWGLPEDTSPQPLFSRGRPLLVTNVARGPFLLSLGDPGARDERGRWLPAVAGSLLARVTGSCFNLTFDTEVFLSYKAWRFHDFRFLLAAEKGQGARPSAWLGWWPERQFGRPGDRARNLGWKPRHLKNLTGCFAFSRAALIGAGAWGFGVPPSLVPKSWVVVVGAVALVHKPGLAGCQELPRPGWWARRWPQSWCRFTNSKGTMPWSPWGAGGNYPHSCSPSPKHKAGSGCHQSWVRGDTSGSLGRGIVKAKIK